MSYIFILLASVQASATLKFVSVAGASNYHVEDSIVYGGIAGDCLAAAKDGTNLCNSCVKDTLEPCNLGSIYPSLALRLTMRTESVTVPNTTVKFIFKVDSATLEKQLSITSNSDFTVTAYWHEICGLLGLSSNCDVSGSTIKTATVETGLDLDNNGTIDTDSSKNLQFKINNLNSEASNYASLTGLCGVGGLGTDVGYGGSSNVGICSFDLEPGDAKIYIGNFSVGTVSGGLITPAFSGFPQNGFVLFYSQASDASDASKSMAMSTIVNRSPNKTFSLKSDGTDVLMDSDRADGFDNDVTYCFVLANQNAAGNIFYFTPPALFSNSELLKQSCVTPSQVVGLLDDKHCFIATAAYGSPLAEEVETLREFRNKYLIPFEVGRKFVKWYYSWSPAAAEVISNSDHLRTAATIVLWPVLIVAKVFLFLSFWPALLVSVLFFFFLRFSFKNIQFFRLRSKNLSSRGKKF